MPCAWLSPQCPWSGASEVCLLSLVTLLLLGSLCLHSGREAQRDSVPPSAPLRGTLRPPSRDVHRAQRHPPGAPAVRAPHVLDGCVLRPQPPCGSPHSHALTSASVAHSHLKQSPVFFAKWRFSVSITPSTVGNWNSTVTNSSLLPCLLIHSTVYSYQYGCVDSCFILWVLIH